MNEVEWLTATDPTPMLKFLTPKAKFLAGKASDRRLRLCLVAAVRTSWDQIDLPNHVQLVNTAEQFADGKATEDDLGVVRTQLYQDHNRTRRSEEARCGSPRLDADAHQRLRRLDALQPLVLPPKKIEGLRNLIFWSPLKGIAGGRLVTLFHDVFGNPFRPSPPLPSAVLAWNDATVRRLAEAIYEERKMPEATFDPARLGILADALLDAGCVNEDLIQHLRGLGPHVRGCWALDLVLGKQ
jgi:hypothetical protein